MKTTPTPKETAAKEANLASARKRYAAIMFEAEIIEQMRRTAYRVVREAEQALGRFGETEL